MKGNPWLELLLVVALLTGGGLMVAKLPRVFSKEQGLSAGVLDQEASANEVEDLMLQLRFAEAPSSYRIEVRDSDGQWLDWMQSEEAVEMDFEIKPFCSAGSVLELRAEVEWPVEAGESVMEVRARYGSGAAVKDSLWGSGRVRGILKLPLGEDKERGSHDD